MSVSDTHILVEVASKHLVGDTARRKVISTARHRIGGAPNGAGANIAFFCFSCDGSHSVLLEG